MNLFLQGFLIGFTMSMPVGLIAMLCISHSLLRGSIYGLIAGLGAASADTVYAILGGFGFSMICDFLTSHHVACKLLGALFLCYMGVSTLRSPPKEKTKELMTQMSYLRVFITSFFLTLTNPLTILGFIGIYAALGIGFVDEKILSICTITWGVFVGSSCWWLILSVFSEIIGKKLNFKSTLLLNRISGSAFLVFGLFVALTAFSGLPFI